MLVQDVDERVAYHVNKTCLADKLLTKDNYLEGVGFLYALTINMIQFHLEVTLAFCLRLDNAAL